MNPPQAQASAPPVVAPIGEPPKPEPTCLWGATPPPPPNWLARGFLPEREICLFSGEGGSYKSTAALALAVAVASGTPAYGAYPTQQGPVLILSEEDGLGVIQNRVAALLRGADLPHATLMEMHVLALEGFTLDDQPWTDHLAAWVGQNAPALIIFDPLSDMLGHLAENQADDTRPIVQWWRYLTTLGATVLACHHLTKPKEGFSGANRVRGSSSWANAARAIYSFQAQDKDLQVTCDKLARATRPDRFTMTLQVETHPHNAAQWLSAALLAPAPTVPGAILHRRELTQGERKALLTLDTFRGEPLPFGRWWKAADLSEAGMTKILRRLVDLDYVQRNRAGKRAGRDTFTYELTPEGLAAALDTTRHYSDTTPDTTRVQAATTPTLLPLRGNSVECSGSGASSAGPDTTPPDDAWWDSLEPDAEENAV